MLRNGSEHPVQAIVLAGGYGSRLRSLIADVPKPMARVAGRPFVSYVFDDLVDHEIKRIVVAVSWLRESIMSEFGACYRGVELRYSVEAEPLGTGGAIRQAFQCINDDGAFVLNGDTFQRLPYARMRLQAEEERADVLVGIRAVDSVERYGTVELEGSSIIGFSEKGTTGPGLINAGAYIVRRDVVENPSLGKAFSFEQDVLGPGVGSLNMVACLITGNFIDIGIPEDYLRAKQELASWFSRTGP
jgi:D-glycero-alpha-D-manno-heptose 1-phosphate guanylyltransferase